MASREIEALAKYLKAQAEALERLVARGRRHLDTVSTHQIRVAVRRTRAVLWLLEHASPRMRPRKPGQLDRRLRALSKGLGQARELSVAHHDAKRYHLDPASISADEKKARHRATGLLREIPAGKIHKSLRSTLRTLHRCQTFRFSKAGNRLRRQLAKFPTRPSKAKGALDLHQLRIEARKARYVLEALGKSTVPLERLQNSLGRAHDLRVLTSFFGDFPAVRKDLEILTRKLDKQTGPALRSALKQLESLK